MYSTILKVIVQRLLAAKNFTHAKVRLKEIGVLFWNYVETQTFFKGGTLLAGGLKILPMFLLVFPGMAARILFKDQVRSVSTISVQKSEKVSFIKVACSDPIKCQEICGSEKGCSNVAYVFLVLKLMPQGSYFSRIFISKQQWVNGGLEVFFSSQVNFRCSF